MKKKNPSWFAFSVADTGVRGWCTMPRTWAKEVPKGMLVLLVPTI